tara:strand:+ start:330 stop:1439 length:1110 start_codon:yes stop_codon:yes gene_type:complete
VGDRKFSSKAMAVEYACRTGEQVHFEFFNDFYHSLDWSTEPAQSLHELYRARAEQLLSSYDRVILLLSGGSDSTAMVNIFLQNGLRPHQVVSHTVINSSINKNAVTNVEITRSASKTAKLCMELGVPYRVINLWDNIKNVEYDYHWFDTADSRMSIDNLIKFEGVNNDREIRKMVDSGKKVCLVSGFEKPRVFIHEGYFQAGHLDIPLTQNFYSKNKGLHKERFYTTKDMPTIEIKQCHTIIKHYEKHVPDYEKLLVHTADFNVDQYYATINDVLYEGLWKDRDYFTLGKLASSKKYTHLEEVMPDHKIVKSYKGLVRDFYKSINSEKYINDFLLHPSGRISNSAYADMKGFYSNFYKIKKLNANESAK